MRICAPATLVNVMIFLKEPEHEMQSKSSWLLIFTTTHVIVLFCNRYSVLRINYSNILN